MERGTKHINLDESRHELRKFIESEYALEWSTMFGDWLPGMQPELRAISIARKVEVEPSKKRWYVLPCGQR
jgi:hypothetical protein